MKRTLVADSSITVRKLTPELLGDFLAFFEGEAFADNPGWSSCYCQCFLVDHSSVSWKDRSAEENRAQACDFIRTDRMRGTLAYLDGRPVGWCHAGPWRLMTALHDEPDPLSDKLGEITCFLVAAPYRGRGVATALLRAACEGLREQGLEIAEAYAKTHSKDAGANHHGPLSMYLAAGFTVHRPDGDDGVYVRKSLAQG